MTWDQLFCFVGWLDSTRVFVGTPAPKVLGENTSQIQIGAILKKGCNVYVICM